MSYRGARPTKPSLAALQGLPPARRPPPAGGSYTAAPGTAVCSGPLTCGCCGLRTGYACQCGPTPESPAGHATEAKSRWARPCKCTPDPSLVEMCRPCTSRGRRLPGCRSRVTDAQRGVQGLIEGIWPGIPPTWNPCSAALTFCPAFASGQDPAVAQTTRLMLGVRALQFPGRLARCWG